MADEQYDDNGPRVSSNTASTTAGLTLWPLGDHLGSIRDVVDNNGVIRQHVVYDSFGNRLSEVNYDAGGVQIDSSHADAIDLLFGYTGRDWDEDVGLQYNRARWYDPATGRWISQDPAEDDLNLYRYVKNNPINREDPSGLEDREFAIPEQTVEFALSNPNLYASFREKYGVRTAERLDMVLASGWKIEVDDVFAWHNAYQDASSQMIWIEEDMTIGDQAFQLRRLVNEIYVGGGIDPSVRDTALRAGDVSTWKSDGNQHQALIRGKAMAKTLIVNTARDAGFEFVTAGGGLFFTKADDMYSFLRYAADKGGDFASVAPKGLKLLDEAGLPGGIRMVKPADQAGNGLRAFSHTIKDGRLRRPIAGQRLGSFKGQRIDFVVLEDGRLILGHGHSVLTNGADTVRFAGQLKFSGTGNLTEITNWSGHYPSTGLTINAKEFLESIGIDVSNAKAIDIAFPSGS